MKLSLVIKKIFFRFSNYFNRLRNHTHQDIGIERVMQVGIAAQWREMAYKRVPLPPLRDVGFQIYSESDEDGILQFIFSIIGTTNKTVVDVGAAGLDGFLKGSNSANLLINHGWHGLLIDGDRQVIELAKNLYSSLPSTSIFPPKLVNEFITAESIDGLIRKNGFEGDTDLLCIDIDGMDYWIWKAISVLQPRAVVVEYRDILGPQELLTVPYRSDFNRNSFEDEEYRNHYYGASLSAFVSLAKQKGYRLIGCNNYCFNAFFIKNGIGEEHLPEVSPSSCFNHARAKFDMKKYFPSVKNMPWEKVG